MSARTYSATHQILMFIRDHPEGVQRREIADAFMGMVKLPTINTILATLRNRGLIYNDGIMGAKGSTWFSRTVMDIAEPYASVAVELIAELHEVHYAGQERYLAKRLQEIFGSETPKLGA